MILKINISQWCGRSLPAVVYLWLLALLCTLPQDPLNNPENVQLTILPADTAGIDSATIGDTLIFSVATNLARLVDSLKVEVGETVSVYTGIPDTLTIATVLKVPGNSPIKVTGYCRNGIVRNSYDTVYVGSIPLTITEEPRSCTVVEGNSALIFLNVTGNPVPAIQWFRDSVAIDSATGDSLFINNTSTAMDGYTYRARVANSVDTIWSRQAVLSINAVIFRWDEKTWDHAVWH